MILVKGWAIQGVVMAKKNKSLDEQLRIATRKSGRTPYSIAKEAGTTPEVVSRFLKGADIRISTASKIAAVLGLKLTDREKNLNVRMGEATGEASKEARQT